MFGSLVIVLPAPHDGGALLLRYAGREWLYDSATELAEYASEIEIEDLRIGYVALYSDIEHEVALVNRGYRITITYNLYFDTPTKKSKKSAAPTHIPTPPKPSSPPPTEPVAQLLNSLLSQPDFLPSGGWIGFGLQHEYPFPKDSPNKFVPLAPVEAVLKGSDRIIMNAVRQYGLQASLYVVYSGDRGDDQEAMLDKLIKWSRFGQIDSEIGDAVVEQGGIPLLAEGESEEEGEEEEDGYGDEECHCYNERTLRRVPQKITWITPRTGVNTVNEQYIAYGNEANIGWVYGVLVLVAKVGQVGNRARA